jgi:hypothetical protein
VVRLEFTPEVQNLQALQKPLRPVTRRGVSVCPGLQGEMRYGDVPYREPGERISSTEHFLPFAAAYGNGPMPDVLFDLDQDHNLECDERLPLLTDERRPGKAFRTVTLSWQGRQQRYRLTLPVRLEGTAPASYQLELVDVPVARWKAPDGTETLWILYDGNFNGHYDRRFGDGFLVDLTGKRQIRVDPKGDNFFSYHLPLALPWGTYELADLDPRGRSAVLRRLPDDRRAEVTALASGEKPGALQCEDLSGRPVMIGESGRHQILFFWLSHCGSCGADAEALRPLLKRIGPERIGLVGVSLDEHADSARTFAARHPLPGSQCFSGKTSWDNALARRFGVVSPSSFVLLAPDGTILFQGIGVERLKAVLAQTFPELQEGSATSG